MIPWIGAVHTNPVAATTMSMLRFSPTHRRGCLTCSPPTPQCAYDQVEVAVTHAGARGQSESCAKRVSAAPLSVALSNALTGWRCMGFQTGRDSTSGCGKGSAQLTLGDSVRLRAVEDDGGEPAVVLAVVRGPRGCTHPREHQRRIRDTAHASAAGDSSISSKRTS